MHCEAAVTTENTIAVLRNPILILGDGRVDKIAFQPSAPFESLIFIPTREAIVG